MCYADKDNRIHRKSTKTTVKRPAQAILAKKRTEAAEHRHLDVMEVSNTTFSELCKQYWDTRGQHLRMKGVDSMIEAWKKWFGNPLVRELTAAKIEKVLNDRMTAGAKEASAARESSTTDKAPTEGEEVK